MLGNKGMPSIRVSSLDAFGKIRQMGLKGEGPTLKGVLL